MGKNPKLSPGLNDSTAIIYTQTLIGITIKVSIRLNVLSIPLWHSITFDVFTSNSISFSVVIEKNINVVGYRFVCKSPIRRSHGCPLVGKCKILFLTEKCMIFYM